MHVSERTVVVGAAAHDYDGRRSGAAYVFQLADTRWSQTDKLIPHHGRFGDFFGVAVAASSHSVLVGAMGRDSDITATGLAYLWTRERLEADPPVENPLH